MQIKILSLLLILISLHSFSQEVKEISESELEPKLVLNISPLSLIDVFDNTSLRLGLDAKLTNRFRLSSDGGVYFGLINALKLNPEGFIIKSELKYKLFEYSYPKQYLGIEYQYKEQSYGFYDSISINKGPVFEKQYKINRKMNCISLKYTFVEDLGNRFTFEYFFGLGIRYLRSYNNLTKEENDGILDDEFHGGTQSEYLIRPIGKIDTINLICGIKIGFIIK